MKLTWRSDIQLTWCSDIKNDMTLRHQIDLELRYRTDVTLRYATGVTSRNQTDLALRYQNDLALIYQISVLLAIVSTPARSGKATAVVLPWSWKSCCLPSHQRLFAVQGPAIAYQREPRRVQKEVELGSHSVSRFGLAVRR